MPRIIIEVSGGLVVAVHSDDPSVNVVVRDHDNIEAGDEDPTTDAEIESMAEVW